MTRQILILTTTIGFGHMSAAKAIAAALQAADTSVNVTIANPVEQEQTSDMLKEIHDGYDATSGWKSLYELLYKISDTGLASAATDSAVTAMLRDSVYSILQEHQPDMIISVHEDYLAPLKSLRDLMDFSTPIITVITDLTTIHRRWFNRVADYIVVPTDAARQQALERGFRESAVQQIGIPVHPEFARETRTQDTIRQELGWQTDIPTFLVVGSRRVRGLVDNLHGVNHSGLRLQLALIAGGDDNLHEAFQNTEWHLPVQIYNYVDDMPAFIHASDAVISKAGGLIVSETLACARPLLITDVIEGQETGNVQYVLDNQAGARAQTPLDVLETVFHWLTDDATELKALSENANNAGNPQAASRIAELVLSVDVEDQANPFNRNIKDA